MKNRLLWLAIVLMTVVGAAGCNSNNNMEEPSDPTDDDNERVDITLTRGEQTLVTRNNDFAFNLIRAVAKDKSMVLSPLSVTYALGMLNNGAEGLTQQQINTVLGFSSASETNDFCRKMLTEAPKLDNTTKVMIANTVYVNKDYTLNPKFVKLANDYYDATPESRNFKDGRTLDVINKWASDHTEKMVEKVLDTNSFDTDAVSYLLNAIYFKGVWANKFLKSETKDEEFEGVENKLPMMHQERELAYSENEDCQVVRLPYGNHAYTMTILLPRKGKTVEKVLEGLTCESWRQKYQYLGSALVDLKLPRFETKTDVGLNDIMKSLGMPLAFTDDAEFPYFCDVPTKIDMMKQVARIKLDEEGTEAAAVTVIGMVKATSVAPTEPRRVNFHATRPFLYVISEQSTGAIFFIGQYLGN